MQADSNTAAPAQPRRGPWGWVLGVGVAVGLCVLVVGAFGLYWALGDSLLGTAPVAPVVFAELPAGQAEAGQTTFNSVGCTACHSLEPDVRQVGPSLAGLSARAATRKDGYTAEDYILESIVDPNAYTVDSFGRGIMPSTFRNQLSDQELADLVAFLMTQ